MKYIYKILPLLGILTLLSCSEEPSLVDRPDSIVDSDPANAPQRFLDETWNNHEGTFYRYYFDENVAVYYNETAEEDIDWPYSFTSSVWGQVRNSYDGFDEDELYVILHREDVDPFFANIHDDNVNKYLIDMTLASDEINNTEKDAILREVSNIVETSAFGINESPASEIWKEQWAEIFLYDIYTSSGMEEDAERVMNANLDVESDFPVENTFWFRDWFLPLYENYDGGVALNNFFRSLSQHFPKEENSYERDLNFGEFIHFFSGAAGEDLQPLAEDAFGWSDEWQTELYQARADFPDANYSFESTSDF